MPTSASALTRPRVGGDKGDALLPDFGNRLLGAYYAPSAEYDSFALFAALDDGVPAVVEIADAVSQRFAIGSH
jgi:hypothetical protein